MQVTINNHPLLNYYTTLDIQNYQCLKVWERLLPEL
jgi:hypothetical protein